MIYELVGQSTDARSEDIRWRSYTTSLFRAQSFARIPKIQFTDSGHGIVFSYRRVSRRQSVIHLLDKYVKEHLVTIDHDRRADMKRASDPTLRVGSETGYAGGMAPKRQTGWPER